ncbi:MAG TPA: ribosome modulation factor [Spongiibacteraceae bacterium]|jgi:ribosome modulation factor|nr:ribosome modulation factor [Spongiibacteraceae bacterium]HUH37095.1 ribosome modulation factor [Spongiibacteraceae bacterium]
MKRQKRNPADRAFQRGYLAGMQGRDRDSCPHEQTDARSNWMAGWREGRSDQWDGMIGVSSLHRQPL